MAHDPTVVDIKRGDRHPRAGLVLANFLHYDSVVRLRNDFCSRAPLSSNADMDKNDGKKV